MIIDIGQHPLDAFHDQLQAELAQRHMTFPTKLNLALTGEDGPSFTASGRSVTEWSARVVS